MGEEEVDRLARVRTQYGHRAIASMTMIAQYINPQPPFALYVVRSPPQYCILSTRLHGFSTPFRRVLRKRSGGGGVLAPQNGCEARYFIYSNDTIARIFSFGVIWGNLG